MGDPVKNIVNFRTSGMLNPAEIVFQVSGGVENATIDWTQRNFEETTLEIWTGPGSTGTKLTLTTDYSLSLKNDFVSTKSGLEIYSGVQITNVIYQSVNLYIPINTLNMFGDIIDESDINRLQNSITPIGSTYIQFPGDSDPSTLGMVGTWSNVSSELAGDFIRFEGGLASAFEAGQQLDAGQRITGTTQLYRGALSPTGVFTVGAGGTSTVASGTAGGAHADFDSANSVSPNAAKTNDVETRAVNRTVRKWRRTA